ncbi:MAG: tRNA (guanosine(37)-N1)-methyltransferase TrmD [Patescibacteria group bacterium]|nr:tRNA (guanosine(37)-N1)-methyltransferase TrmD [Patescibacteria group bacterium]
MKITILTLFPEMFVGPFDHSIVKRAQEKGLIELKFVNIRDFGLGAHKMVDDRPFGGGTGMVLRVDVIDHAIQAVRNSSLNKTDEQCVLLDARGKTYSQIIAHNFSKLKHLILLCGHYEGVDERIRSLVDATISIGDFILTGGEIPAMLIIDSVSRLVSGVLKEDATTFESFSTHEGMMLLEYPQYTQPREYNSMSVPEVLVGGNHKRIEEWKKEQGILITKTHRPDLLRE